MKSTQLIALVDIVLSVGKYSWAQVLIPQTGFQPAPFLSKGDVQGGKLTEEFYAAQTTEYPGVTKPVFVGNDVWIGSRAVIMAGVEIGHGAVVAAGAIVTRDVELYAILAGVPARLIRKRFDDAVVARLLESEWWRVRPSLIKGLDYSDVNLMLDKVEDLKMTEKDWEYLPRIVTLSAA